MIDHIGFPVSDYARSKAFYAQALAPLGYALMMEIDDAHTESRAPAAGVGRGGKPDFWIGGEGGLEKPLHVALVAVDRASVDAFFVAARAAGGMDNGAPGLRPHYHATYYAAFVLDPDGHNIEAVCHSEDEAHRVCHRSHRIANGQPVQAPTSLRRRERTKFSRSKNGSAHNALNACTARA